MDTPREVPDSAMPPDTIVTQALCKRHATSVRLRLHLTEVGPWRDACVLTGVLLFRRVSARRQFQARCGGTPDEHAVETINLVLAEIGCLACWDSSAFTAAIACLRKGASYVSDIIHGRLADPDFPLDGTEPT